MRLLCERDILAPALAVVLRRSKAGLSIAILDHVLLSTLPGTLMLLGHNLDASCRASIPANVSETGAIAVSGESFGRLIQALPEGSQVTLGLDERGLSIRAAGSRYMLPTLPAADFPPALEPVNPSTFMLDGLCVRRLFGIQKTVICATEDRVYLQGAYLHNLGPNVLASVATDQHRLIRTEVQIDCALPRGIIIPKDAIEEIRNIAGDGGEFTCSEDVLSVSVGGKTFSTKLIDEKFPDYARIIPSMDGPFIELARRELLDSLSRLDLVSEKYSHVKFAWNGDTNVLTARNMGVGSGEEAITCIAQDMPPGTIAVPPRQFRELINALPSERLRLYIGGVKQPFRIVDPDDPGLVVIQVPSWFAPPTPTEAAKEKVDA